MKTNKTVFENTSNSIKPEKGVNH